MKPHEIKLDFVRLADEYAGKWVAMNPETYDVVAVGSSAEEVLEKANRAGLEEPLITDVVDDYGAYVPCVQP